ncbi:MAG: transglutaminase-like domain-containing protein [Planctomycetota bacterium]|nr:transglutaminase-like domain-containing protein [Planctomycetota bacterium]MDA1137448.1 transglutaminase-like domain-containing protein [Planctomycetota bacterium]
MDPVPAKLKKYVGLRPPVPDQSHRARIMAFTLLTECLAAPNTPFRAMAANGLYLCNETEAYIYDRHGFINEAYVKGSRPIQEAWVNEVVSDGMSDREKAIALNRCIPAMREKYGKVPVFLYGESDEQTVLKGGGHCSCRSRLLTSFCQIAGLQARPVMFWTVPDPEDPAKILGGHTVAEIFVDGSWAFFDPMPAIYCQKPDGSLASIRDIREDPSLITSMSDAVLKEMKHSAVPRDGMEPFDYMAWRFFQKIVPTCFSVHHVNGDYRERWNYATSEFKGKLNHDYELYQRVLGEMASKNEITDEVYSMGAVEFRDFKGLSEAQMDVPEDW